MELEIVTLIGANLMIQGLVLIYPLDQGISPGPRRIFLKKASLIEAVIIIGQASFT